MIEAKRSGAKINNNPDTDKMTKNVKMEIIKFCDKLNIRPNYIEPETYRKYILKIVKDEYT